MIVKFYIHFHWISCLPDKLSYFISYTSLCIILHEIDVWNMWGKLINCIFKMKTMESNCSWKWALCLYERAPLFDKWALGWSKRAGGGEIPNQKLFLILWNFDFKFRKKIEKALFYKVSNSWMLYLSEIVPEIYFFIFKRQILASSPY